MLGVPRASRALGALGAEPPRRLCFGSPGQSAGVRCHPRRFFSARHGHTRAFCHGAVRSRARASCAPPPDGVMRSQALVAAPSAGPYARRDLCVRCSPAPISRVWGSLVPPVRGVVVGSCDVPFEGRLVVRVVDDVRHETFARGVVAP
jgi:hypothetical protein